jgi:hypothetical protein
MEHEFEHAWSVEKPSSENHAWSYKMACDACLAEIQVQNGVDWKITDIVFEDLGRETTTRSTWDGARKWKCTHKVKALYNIVHRGEERAFKDTPFIEEQLNITYKMIPFPYPINPIASTFKTQLRREMNGEPGSRNVHDQPKTISHDIGHVGGYNVSATNRGLEFSETVKTDQGFVERPAMIVDHEGESVRVSFPLGRWDK